MRVAVFPPIYLPNTELMQVMQHAIVFNVLDSACSYKTIMWIVNFATATSVRKLMIRPVIGVIKIEIMTEGAIISSAKGKGCSILIRKGKSPRIRTTGKKVEKRRKVLCGCQKSSSMMDTNGYWLWYDSAKLSGRKKKVGSSR